MASGRYRETPSYRPGTEPTEARVSYLIEQLIDKVLERRSNLKLGLKELFRKHDVDNSGFLEMDEGIRALEDFLPGYQALEYQGMLSRFDQDKSGTLSIHEVAQMMNDMHHGDGLPDKPLPPADWGNEVVDRPPPPPRYVDSMSTLGFDGTMSRMRQSGSGGLAAGGGGVGVGDDDAASDLFEAELTQKFWDGNNMERMYRIMSKLRDTLYEKSKQNYKDLSGPGRLFKDKELLIRDFAKRELRRLFEHPKSAGDVVADPDDEAVRRVNFDKFRRVLKLYRTPGQPFAMRQDLEELWELCDDGNIELFFKVLYESEANEVQTGEVAQARERANRELPGIEYPQTKSTVFPPAGWEEEKKSLLRRSAQVPSRALEMEYVYGYNCEANGRNCYQVHDASTGEPLLVYFVAAVVVVHNPATKAQRFFLGHTDDVTAMAVDESGTLCATGQCASIFQGSATPPLVLVWDLETLELLKTIDSRNSPANIQRAVSGLCFSRDSRLLMVVGADDKHVVSIFDLSASGEQPAFLADGPGQVGPPVQVHQVCSAPEMVRAAYCADQVWITTGDSSHVKFWTFKASEAEPLQNTKGTWGDAKDPPRVLWSVAHLNGDDVTFIGGSNGTVSMWRFPGECFRVQRLHRPDHMVYALAGQKDGKHMWSGGADQRLKQWAIKDYKFTCLREYDMSFEGAGRVKVFEAPALGSDAGRPPPSEAGSARSARSRRSAKSASKSSSAGGTGTGGAAKTKKAGAAASSIRKKKEEAKGVVVKDLVIISRAGDDAGADEGLVCCTDGGAMWYVDWARESVDEIFACHAGSPLKDTTAVGGVHCVSPHPFRNAVFASVGEDKQLAVWDTSLRERRAMGRLPEMAHAVDWSPDGTHLAVGFVGGYFGVYDAATMERLAWHRRSREDIDVVKFSPDGRQVATGSHENTIDLFDVRNKKSPYHHRKKLTGHSSSIKKLDWSADSLILQSNCAAYEILYWDAIKGKCLRASRDSTESDTIWATWTCTLGFPVMGVWYEGWDRTDVNAVHRSNDGELVVLVDDFGSVNLLNAPCLIKHAPRRVYQGHCSHVEDVTFLKDDHRVVTAGGHDKAIIQYKVVSASSESGASMHLSASLSNNVGSLGGGGDAPSDTRVGESILLPPKGQIRPAWTRVRYAGK